MVTQSLHCVCRVCVCVVLLLPETESKASQMQCDAMQYVPL